MAGVAAARARVAAWVEHEIFQRAIIALIVVNAVAIGLETMPAVVAVAGPLLSVFDQAVVVVFAVEVGLRIFACGGRFFRDPWSLFDLAIVLITVMPIDDSFLVLRTLRILRVLRLLSIFPQLRRIVAALLRAVPGVGAISALLGLVFYVFAVIATKLFGAAFPDWFGSISASTYSLFQIMTLESWSMGIVRPVMEVYPLAWLFFVSFIMLSTFTVLNLFIAIIIDSMQSLQKDEATADISPTELAARYDALAAELAEIKALLAARPRNPAQIQALPASAGLAFAGFAAMMAREFFSGGRERMKIYHAPNTRSHRIVWLFEELGLPYELVLFKLGAPEMRAPEYRKVHPMGRVPALEDDSQVIFESGAIIQYVLARHGGGRLVPAVDAPEFPTYLQWFHYAEGMLMPPVNTMVVETVLLPPERRNETNVKRASKLLGQMLAAVEQGLEGRDYFTGEFTAADIITGQATIVSARLGGDISDKPNVTAYIERLKARPAYQRAVDAA